MSCSAHKSNAGNEISSWFETTAHNFPDRPALHINDRFYSYQDLAKVVSRISAIIPEEKNANFIGIYCNDSVYTYAAIIALLSCGRCYAPLNAKLGEARLREIVKDAELNYILTEKKLDFLESEKQILLKENRVAAYSLSKSIQPYAYLLYTSGSTGEPKGVPIKKESLEYFFRHFDQNFDFNETDRFLQPYELSWDVSVFCMWSAWRCGACVYSVSHEGIRSMQILDVIHRYQITVVSIVPSVISYAERYLSELNCENVRYTFFAGEALSEAIAAKWQNCAFNSRIFNYYGPTEATIYCSGFECKKSENSTLIPIGKIFTGLEYLIVNENYELAEHEGMLLLAGPQIIDSYLKGADNRSFHRTNGKKYYATGDLVKKNRNGDLIFRGRMDSQVKINGYRLELTEIENMIYNFTGENAIVRAIEINNSKQLVAFIRKISKEVLVQKLQGNLPPHMFPQFVVNLKEIPLNINGKIDVQKLTEIANEQIA